MKAIRTTAIVSVLAASPAVAQQATITGRVVENGTITGIVGVRVELSGLIPVITGANGGFTFSRVETGRYTLLVEGLGYALAEIELTIRGDTTFTVELDRAPIRLDSLVVEARDVTVRGIVRDKARDIGLLKAEVSTSNGEKKQTDGIGRFSIKDVPANVPLSIRVEEFGYMPLTATIAPENDTTLRFEMEPDPVVQRMIEQQIGRIAERAGEQRYPYEPVIDREELIASRNGHVIDVITRIIGRSRRIGCIAIDERTYSPYVLDGVLTTMRPDELEYIDVLYYSPDKRSLMVRMYTRDWIRRMIGRDSPLVPLDELIDGAHNGDCR